MQTMDTKVLHMFMMLASKSAHIVSFRENLTNHRQCQWYENPLSSV